MFILRSIHSFQCQPLTPKAAVYRFIFDENQEKGPLLSYGPCQFPTLGFMVERAWEIADHVTEQFWSIHVTYQEASSLDATSR